MVGCLPSLRPPFFRILANNVHGRIESVNIDRFDVVDSPHLVAELQRCVDCTLRVIFRWPKLDVRSGDHEWLAASAHWRHGKWPGQQLHESEFPFEDGSWAGKSFGRKDGGEDAVARCVGERTPLP